MHETPSNFNFQVRFHKQVAFQKAVLRSRTLRRSTRRAVSRPLGRFSQENEDHATFYLMLDATCCYCRCTYVYFYFTDMDTMYILI